jgi:hypothetical protein
LKSLLNSTYTYPKEEKKLFTNNICIGVWVNAMVTLMETNSKPNFFLSFHKTILIGSSFIYQGAYMGTYPPKLYILNQHYYKPYMKYNFFMTLWCDLKKISIYKTIQNSKNCCIFAPSDFEDSYEMDSLV